MKIPVSRPDVTELEMQYVSEAVHSTWISSTGKFIDLFESTFASATGQAHCLTTSNGTTALHLALEGLGIKPGDEVIVPSLTYVASVNCIRYCGAFPVFVDVDEQTLCLSPKAVEVSITPRTRAILAVHLYGRSADTRRLRSIADTHSLFLIEDVAEAPFAAKNSQQVGQLGDVSTYSFFGNKIISSGEGGAVTTPHDDLYRQMKLLRNQGMDPERRYYFPILGYNYRLTNVAAAILVAQLERLKEMLHKRNTLFENYRKVLSGSHSVTLQTPQIGETISPWLFPVIVESQRQRDELIDRLTRVGVESRPFFIPCHELPMYESFRHDQLSVSIEFSRRGMNLPTSSAFSDSEVDALMNRVEHVFGK